MKSAQLKTRHDFKLGVRDLENSFRLLRPRIQKATDDPSLVNGSTFQNEPTLLFSLLILTDDTLSQMRC